MSTPTPEILLRQCPFCGGDDVFVERDDFESSYVTCDTCDAQGGIKRQEDDDEEVPGKQAAIRAWNTRANPLSPAEAERIREALAACSEVGDLPMGVLCQVSEALALLDKAAGGK